jgi:hypothetical protein
MRADGMTDRRTGGQMDMTKLITLASPNSANASKMFSFFNFSFLNINLLELFQVNLDE